MSADKDRRGGYGSQALAVLNAREINWDPEAQYLCRQCEDMLGVGRPGAGSYAADLGHFESELGPLESPRNGLRCLILFKAPRDPATVRRFDVVAPDDNDGTRDGSRHRYFCLTLCAWRSLGLDRAVGEPCPRWPTEQDAHLYLRTYLRRDASRWSYDAFLAWLLYRLRPEAAYITNLVKCHFGDRHNSRIDRLCQSTVLRREWELVRPNLVIAFAGDRGRTGRPIKAAWMAGDSETVHLRLPHPAAKGHYLRPVERARALAEGLLSAREQLARVGLDVASIIPAVRDDIRRCL